MIEVKDVAFSYTKKPFLQGITFTVEKGEIFGFLGPSGAGKSTLQKILIGMLPSYTGTAIVDGTDMRRRDNRFYEHIGVDFEFPSFYEKLSARKNLAFFASLYSGKTRDIDALLDSVGLLQDADKPAGEFSKGMKSRLNFIKALVHDPDILFLDEPTSGLDPANSQRMKDCIRAEAARGKTILLTTHNMEDAAELCSRVAFIVDGKLKALDTPHHLVLRKSAGSIVYTYREAGAEHTGSCALEATGQDARLQELMAKGKLQTIHSREQTLGDVFMEVTGRRLS
ncbi:MAG: ABC transporter ATP-binding protein [Faecalibacterium sp.]|jgi:fluoroquinolone transport system ATP-binding protein|nr:ABC transporter ATP-binding protein [Faecalibacterium sp.]